MAQSLDMVRVQVSTCTHCGISQTRKQTVFGNGLDKSRLMFLGEAPGAEEDEQGEPFVGPAGKLLNNIIKACGWERDEIYVANILKCRPPNNRRPSQEETSNCRVYLDQQIALVKPEWIVCLGTTAACSLLNKESGINNLRGQVYDYAGIKVVCTFHPAYLLRSPEKKREVWEDMQIVIEGLRNENR